MQPPKSPWIRFPTQLAEQRSILRWLGEVAAELSPAGNNTWSSEGPAPLANCLLVAAYSEDQIVGAIFARTWDCGVIQLFPPRVVAEEAQAVTEQLMVAIHQHDALRQSRLCFSHLSAREQLTATAFRRLGYQQSNDVLILGMTLAQAARLSTKHVRLTRCKDAELNKLADVIRETYTDTSDFPDLQQHWTAQDALQVYRPATPDTLHHWYLASERQTAVGCLLMTESPKISQCEITYMGVLPRRRQRGWGTSILDAAFGVAESLRTVQVVLGVDSGNEPAIRLYSRAGFEPIDRRQCFWRTDDS